MRQIIIQWRQSITGKKGTLSAVNLACCSDPKDLSLAIQSRARIENKLSCSVLIIVVAVVVVATEQ